MVNTTSKNCYCNYHILFWYDVNLVRNFWNEEKIWNLVEAVIAEQWEWAFGREAWIVTLALMLFLNPDKIRKTPFPG